MSNTLQIGSMIVVPASAPFVTARHGLGVPPDALNLTVIATTGGAGSPTFALVAVDSISATWQWQNPPAGATATVAISVTTSLPRNPGDVPGSLSVAAALQSVSAGGGGGGGGTAAVAASVGPSNQTLADGATVDMTLDTVVFDTSSMVDTPNNRIVIPQDGKYSLSAYAILNLGSVTAGTDPKSIFEIIITINGSTKAETAVCGFGGGGLPSAMVSRVFDLKAGDAVKVRLMQSLKSLTGSYSLLTVGVGCNVSIAFLGT